MLLQTSQVRNIRDWVSPATLELLHAQDVPDVVFLDMNADGAADFSLAQQLVKLRPSVHIVACSARNLTSPDVLLQAMRSGVRDFLQKPYDRSELSSLIARVVLERRPESASRTSAAKLLVVLGTKGGVGTSTVAVNSRCSFGPDAGQESVRWISLGRWETSLPCSISSRHFSCATLCRTKNASMPLCSLA
jgi:pilus assembly protein CpaE